MRLGDGYIKDITELQQFLLDTLVKFLFDFNHLLFLISRSYEAHKAQYPGGESKKEMFKLK